jgi:hypothetical protein
LAIKLEGLQSTLEEIAPVDPRAKTVKPQEMIDTRYLDELERSGLWSSSGEGGNRRGDGRAGDEEKRRQETEVGWNREVFSKIKAEAARRRREIFGSRYEITFPCMSLGASTPNFSSTVGATSIM